MKYVSHDETTRAVFGVTHETLVRRIVRTYQSATPEQIASGATWYDDARSLAVDLSDYVDPACIRNRVERAAAIISAFSPRTPWARNIAAATAYLVSGERIPGVIGTNWDRAERCHDGGFDGLGNGPKTHAFARNIAGDDTAVTVDVWACRVVGVSETLLSRKGAYAAVAHAYTLAAGRLGVTPATAQATTWICARGGRAA